MRKQELVHLHTLCWEVRSHLVSEHGVSEAAFQRYDRYGVQPTAIYRSKDAHREALMLLLADIDQELQPDRTEVTTTATD